MSIETYELHRRHIFCGGGARVCRNAGLIAWRFEAGAGADVTGSVPEVDRVPVRVVINHHQFAVGAGKKMGSVDVQHFGWGLRGDKPHANQRVRPFDACESKRGP